MQTKYCLRKHIDPPQLHPFPMAGGDISPLGAHVVQSCPTYGNQLQFCIFIWVSKNPKPCRVTFSERHSFQVAKQLKFINAERQVTKREEKTGEAVSSGLPNSLSLRRKSHSLWDIFISWPYGKFSLLGLLAGACCIRISSKGRSSSSGIKHLPILPGAPGQSCHTTASVRRKLEVV